MAGERDERRLLTRRQVLERGGAAAGALGVGWLLAACGGGDDEAAAPAPAPAPAETAAATTQAVETVAGAEGGGGEIDLMTWAINGEPVSMDYALAYDFNTNVPVGNVTETLLRFTPEGQLIPNLAESWEQVDPLTYVYKIRAGVQFHDGSELTADDVAFSLNRHRDADVGSFLATFHERVADVTVTAPLEVTVTLAEPDAHWQYAAATNAAAITSQAFVEANGTAFGTPEVGTMGTGPMKFVSWTTGQDVVLERNDAYWNTEAAQKIAQFSAKIILDEATIVQALGTGEIDGVFGASLSGKSVRALEDFPDVAVYRGPSYLIHYMTINTGQPPFDDKRVRQALSYAIDKAGLLASTWGGEGEAGLRSSAVPAMWTYEEATFQAAYDALPAFDLDLDKAKSLIEEAGATGTEATMLVSLPFDEEQAVAIQAAAQQIGLNLRPEKLPYGDKIAREFSGQDTRDYAMSITQWGSDIPDPAGNLFVPFYSQNVVTNNSAYHNPDVDALLEQQRESSDPAERARLLSEAQALVMEDQPWILFYTPNTLMALNKRIGGYALRPLYYWDPFVGDFSGV
jgi:peptide/nickel transport system substrate-binding protein